MTEEIRFFVEGIPAPKGSYRYNRRRGVMFDASPRLPAWTKAIREAAPDPGEEWDREGWVVVILRFSFAHPQAHYRPDGSLRPVASVDLAPKVPDLDKLERAVLDAIVDAGLIADDGQIIHIASSKEYGSRSGCEIVLMARSGGHPLSLPRHPEE